MKKMEKKETGRDGGRFYNMRPEREGRWYLRKQKEKKKEWK